ncbi:hypothetical protein FA95DRAFT_1546572 [Auriscalpium vulgare]|uniref:Uncharacterized protein n=1 Tax=Auriscalpium vulgare TaxID=40419 RepID=A0ACB8RGY2_9AGAM|nr:hypothetical protein FA95DRAFT_1546572 [Auriscalpium vulgare]
MPFSRSSFSPSTMANERRAHTDLRLPTRDGFPLAAQRFDPPGQVLAAAVIANATGVRARTYHGFARWLSLQGVATCTFDYRYSGLSFPLHLDAEAFTDVERHAAMAAAPRDINLTDTWARQDLAAVIRYASDAWPSVPLTVVGNSMGGLLMTLIPDEWHRITRFLNVNGGNAYYGNTAQPEAARYSVGVVMRERLESDNIFKASELGLGHDIPYGPGLQWMEWFLHPHFSVCRKADADILKRMHLPYLYVGFTDDETVDKRMLESQLNLFSHSDGLKSSLWIDPSAQHPPWLPCQHVTSLVSSPQSIDANLPLRRPVAGRSCAQGQTRAETVWALYLCWIMRGAVAGNVGELRCWTVADERGVERMEMERVEHERAEQARKAGLSRMAMGGGGGKVVWRAGGLRSARL